MSASLTEFQKPRVTVTLTPVGNIFFPCFINSQTGNFVFPGLHRLIDLRRVLNWLFLLLKAMSKPFFPCFHFNERKISLNSKAILHMDCWSGVRLVRAYRLNILFRLLMKLLMVRLVYPFSLATSECASSLSSRPPKKWEELAFSWSCG